MSTYTVRKTGQPFTPEYRAYIEQDGKVVSAWHDIPLYPEGEDNKNVLNMVVEIPRWSNAKMEIAKDDFLNPIKQDTKKGQPRYVPNIFPHKGYPWNYGALPQTWEDPSLTDPHTHKRGDDDPLDVCELGSDVASTGQVKQVKVLGALAILDQGETDWKIIAIDVHDPLASKIDCVADVERHMPTYLDVMKYWFRVYKVPDGKKENEIAMGAEVMDRNFANTLIETSRASWKSLLKEPSTEHRDKSTLADIGIHDDEIAAHVSAQPASDELHAHPNKAAMDRSYFLTTSAIAATAAAGPGRCGMMEAEVKGS